MITAYNETFEERLIRDHAKSLAMFQLRNEDYSSADLRALEKVIYEDLKYLINSD